MQSVAEQILSIARYPIELKLPEGFDPEQLGTWPHVEGRLEFVGGKLLYMPPCGEVQAHTVFDVAGTVHRWVTKQTEFLAGTNEAGMLFGRDARGADVAIWRRGDLGPLRKGFARVAPLLAIEVGGEDDSEQALRDKAAWYLAHGVGTVWLVLPDSREVVVIAEGVDERVPSGATLREPAGLPGLTPAVADFFIQISRR